MTGCTGLRKPSGNVVRVRDGRVLPAMTRIAVGWRTGVPAVDVTTGALGRSMRASQWKARQAVIERRAEPLRRRMTRLAILRESGCRVIRSRCCRVFSQVTRHTGAGRSGIAAPNVTRSARCRCVSTSERKASSGMVKGGGPPCGC